MSPLKEWVNFGDTAKCMYKFQVKHVEDLWHVFFWNFHFLRLRSFKFNPSVNSSGPYYRFLCRSFWICLPVYPSCHWAHRHQIVWALFWPCYPSLWSPTSAAICLQPGPAYLPSITSSCPHHDIPGRLTAHHSLTACCFSISPVLDSCDALWQEYTFFVSSHSFKTIRYPFQEPCASWLQ